MNGSRCRQIILVCDYQRANKHLNWDRARLEYSAFLPLAQLMVILPAAPLQVAGYWSLENV